MTRTIVLFALMCFALTAPLTIAQAEPLDEAAQEEQQSLENPVADPYTPPPGDPDPFTSDGIPGESTSPLNPAED
jgi:hypothetical protein